AARILHNAHRLGFRGRKAAASLKREVRVLEMRQLVRRFRGRKAAASLKHAIRQPGRARHRERFRGRKAAASLKREADELLLVEFALGFPRPKGRGLIEARVSLLWP